MMVSSGGGGWMCTLKLSHSLLQGILTLLLTARGGHVCIRIHRDVITFMLLQK